MKHNILRTPQSLKAALEELKTADIVSFDIETDGVEEHLCSVIGIAWCYDFDEAFYLPTKEYLDGELVDLFDRNVEQELVLELCDVLKDKKLVMHNGVFDIAVMYHYYGVNLTESIYADTILLKHTVDEERPFGLKDLGVRYFGDDANAEQQELGENVKSKGGKWTQKDKELYKGDLDIVAKYAMKDVHLTAKVFDLLSETLEKQGLDEFFYQKEVMPLYREATIPMKLHGVFVDTEYFKNLKTEVERDIMNLTNEVYDLIGDKIEPKVREILDKYINVTRTGEFAKKALEQYNVPVPINKRTGKPSVAKTALQSLEAEYPGNKALEFVLHGNPLDDDVVYDIKKEIYLERNPDKPFIFNLGSSQLLSWLVFEAYGVEPKSYSRKTGAPQVDKDSLEFYKNDIEFVEPLLKLKKSEKLLSTYIKPILDKQTEGWIYPSMLQFGTTSGRYSCGGGLNLQTLPRDDTRIKAGFIAPKGYKIVNADFSALEPRIFSWVSNDSRLKEVWLKGYDLYSQIAIDVFGLRGVSADPSASNYLKKVKPEERQKAKVFTLAVPYGANAWRISAIMGNTPEESQKIIDRYLNAYPGLKDYMASQEEQAYMTGMVGTAFGRIRHLDDARRLFRKHGNDVFSKRKMKAKSGDEGVEEYYRFRNLANNSKNFPIQASAAHVANSSLIYLAELFRINEIHGHIALQIHDEITCIIKEDQAAEAAELLKHAMEENPVAKKIDVPMVSEPLIGDNFAETK